MQGDRVDRLNYTEIMPWSQLSLTGNLAMPTYEFECKKCGHRFNLMESVAEHDRHKERCPQCSSSEIRNLMSTVNVKTTKKS